jgi:CheY-like chemotaxis protein
MGRILCIDGDPSVPEWISGTLYRAGQRSEVVSATTGKAGFNALMQDDFNLCVMEYCLPDLTGVQLCTLLRQSGCHIPIVFLTAMNRAVDRERALRARANAFLAKPEDIDLFVPTVARLTAVTPGLGSGSRIKYAQAA